MPGDNYRPTSDSRLIAALDRLNTGFTGRVSELVSTISGGLSTGPSSGAAGAGAVDSDTQRVTLASDDPAVAALASILAKIIAAPATEAKQDTLIAKDFATQTTLAAILAKIISAPATEAKQDDVITALGTLATKLDTVNSNLDSIETKLDTANGHLAQIETNTTL